MVDTEKITKLAAIVDGLSSRLQKKLINSSVNKNPSPDDMSIFVDEQTGLKIGALAINEGAEIIIRILDNGTSTLRKDLEGIQYGTFYPNIVVRMIQLGQEDAGMAYVDFSTTNSENGIAPSSTSTKTYVKPDYTLKIMNNIPKE